MHLILYNGKEDTAATYVLHEFKPDGTIFSTTHYSTHSKQLGAQKFNADESFIEEEKWELKGKILNWYLRSALFGKPVSTVNTTNYEIVKLMPNEMILKITGSQSKTQ